MNTEPVIANGVCHVALSYVGTNPEEGLAQFRILLELNGLRRDQDVLEIGCGALMASIPIMNFLDDEKFVGIEPNEWLVRDGLAPAGNRAIADAKHPTFLYNQSFDARELGREFDFVIAHSVMSHAGYSQLEEFLVNTHRCLKPNGTVLFSLGLTEANAYGRPEHDEMPKDSVWLYPGGGFFHRSTIMAAAGKLFKSVEVVPEYTKMIMSTHSSANHDWIKCSGKLIP